MAIDLSPLRARVIEEINLLPGEKLMDIYEFIHYFRLGLRLPRRMPTMRNRF